MMNEFVRYISRCYYVLLVTFLRRDIRCRIPKTTLFTHGALNVVISKPVVIGEHCNIGHNVTLGHRGGSACPVIEDYVTISPHSIILGDIRIGHHSIIGAGSVVLESCEPYSVIAGNPAKLIRRIK